jgi:hypothetical protein
MILGKGKLSFEWFVFSDGLNHPEQIAPKKQKQQPCARQEPGTVDEIEIAPIL